MGVITWTEEEDEVLRTSYPTKGTEIPELLKTHSQNAIRIRARRLGLIATDKIESRAWTETKDALIREYYPKVGSKIPELLEFHTPGAISARAKILGIVRIAWWTDADDNLLRELYPVQGCNIPSLLKSHTKNAIWNRAAFLGLSSDKAPVSWTEEECKILREQYPKCGPDIEELLKSHTRKSIMDKARKMGLGRKNNLWTSEELELLRTEYPIRGANIPKLLETRSADRIRNKAHTMGLTIDPTQWASDEDGAGHKAKWTTEEDAIIDKFGATLTAEEIAQKLPGRTRWAVQSRLVSRGFVKNVAHSIVHSSEDVAAASFAYEGTDGKSYFLVRCAKCQRILLLSLDNARGFKHGALCEIYDVPMEFVTCDARNTLVYPKR